MDECLPDQVAGQFCRIYGQFGATQTPYVWEHCCGGKHLLPALYARYSPRYPSEMVRWCMRSCPVCKLKQARWATTKGFVIGNKAYCCMQCGFTGCICLPRPNRKKIASAVPSSLPR